MLADVVLTRSLIDRISKSWALDKTTGLNLAHQRPVSNLTGRIKDSPPNNQTEVSTLC